MLKPRHECWTRLAQAYILLGKHEEACTLLTNATEYEPLLWEIWRDLVLVSVHCKNYGKAAYSYSKILELNYPYLNIDALDKITYGMSSDCSQDRALSWSSDLRNKIIGIFEKLVKLYPKFSPLWCSYGVAFASHENPTEEIRQITLDILSNSIKILLEDKEWFLNRSKINHILKSGKHIALAYLTCSEKFPNTNEGRKLLEIAAKFLASLVDVVEENHRDIINGTVSGLFLDDVNDVNSTLDLIKNKIIDYVLSVQI